MSFPLAGNARVKEAVTSMISLRRIPHAILIDGDKGTGRHTLARYIAQAAVCGGGNAPCGECRSCRVAKSGAHPDITFISPEEGKKFINVGQIRTLRAEAFVKPHMSERRAFVINTAEVMNESAQNAFLKVLEEPPEGVIFILVSLSASELLETVVSRCTRLSLVPPDIDTAIRYISVNTDYGRELIAAAAEETGGNIGAALGILSDGGGEKSDTVEKFIDYMLAGDQGKMLALTADIEKSRIDSEIFIKELKAGLARRIRKIGMTGDTAAKLSEFYYSLSEFEASLATNINLGLLFCAAVCRAAEIYSR